jgi:hypothetical protein
VRLLKAIRDGDARAIAARSRRGDPITTSGSFGGGRKYWVDLLADVASPEQLKALLEECANDPELTREAEILTAAIAKREAR